jgi:hypothetical protein
MAMTDRERILAFLRSVSPRAATNSQILEATGIEDRHLVYELTQELVEEGRIHGVKRDRRWLFWIGEPETMPEPVPARRPAPRLTRRQFEDLAREKMSARYHERLEPGWVGEVHKRFYFVAPYGRIVGHALYHPRMGSARWPPARAAEIAEHVWLLEKTGAPETFLVFGHDRHTPTMWLERYGNLVSGLTFYFLSDDGELEELPIPSAVGGSS